MIPVLKILWRLLVVVPLAFLLLPLVMLMMVRDLITGRFDFDPDGVTRLFNKIMLYDKDTYP